MKNVIVSCWRVLDELSLNDFCFRTFIPGDLCLKCVKNLRITEMKENGGREDLLDLKGGLVLRRTFFRHDSCEKEKELLEPMVEHHMSCYSEDVE